MRRFTLKFDVERDVAAINGGWRSTCFCSTDTVYLAVVSAVGTKGNDFIRGADNPDIIKGKGGDDQIYGELGDDILLGGPGDDILIGGVGDDSLDGGTGNDRIDGGNGIDIMYGGKGDDVYLVDHISDTIIENKTEGNDLIGSYVHYSLPLWVEEIIALSDTPLSLIGNKFDNLIVGNAFENILVGRGGSDSIIGKAGDDTMFGNAGSDTLIGSRGNDELRGGKGQDVLDGGPGNDSLYGGRGQDVLHGGAGNNTLTGGAGQDYFVIGYGGEIDVISDFKIGGAGDRLVIAEDVLDVILSNTILDDYVELTQFADSATIAIDPDGGGDTFLAVARLDYFSAFSHGSLVVTEDGSLMINP